ncbi:hypothetical protein ACS0TY_016035 [Phlomoides rotata]
MAASSLSVAIGTTSHSFSSTSIDHLSPHLFPCKAIPAKTPPKFRTYLISTPPSSLSRSSIYCAPTVFDNVELNQEEGEEVVDGAEEDPIEETVSDGVEEEDDVAQSAAEGGRLYVGNLPFSMTSAQLSDIFAEAGRVVSVEIVYDRVTDRSRGFGFVTMSNVEEAKEAIRLFDNAVSSCFFLLLIFHSNLILFHEAIRLFDNAQIGGRTAKVNFPEVPRGGERELASPKIRTSNQGFVESPHKVYAGNLSWGLTTQGLREAFAEQPGFLSARVVYDRDSGRSRGFGFITFSSAEQLESALAAMNGVEVEGRPLRLNMAEQRAPPSPLPEVQSTSEENVENSEVLVA